MTTYPGSRTLKAKATIRQWHGDLKAKAAIRQPYPYWTRRELIQGVVQSSEDLIGDADLEEVITGVMDDIKVWGDANIIDYDGWIDIMLVPRAIKRATTYAVVAALYARKTRTFQGRVIPTVTPVTITVVGDDEKAMIHWEGKRDEMLDLYLSASGTARLWVSTADEEPVFSMADIPPSGEEELPEWMTWLLEQ